MEQTAVGSIIIDLDNECKARGMFVNWDMYLAKEKEQIINSFGVGCQVESKRLIGYHGMAEQYYNETYNK